MTATSPPLKRSIYTITPTSAHNWAACGGLFAARRREGKAGSSSYALLLGMAIHELIVAYDRISPVDEDALASLVGRHWRPGRFAVTDDASARVEAGGMLALYHATRPIEAVNLLASECFICTEPRGIGDGLAIALSGRIDRVGRRPDGALEILDFKTAGMLPSVDELRCDPATTAYHLLAASRYQADRIVIAQWSLRSGARSEVILQPADLEQGKDRLRTMAREMHADVYNLTPGTACTFCPARLTCLALVPAVASTENEW